MAPTLAESISVITESRPPASDVFTYLTIIEIHLSLELLPHLNALLREDVQLTQDIGWDLIEKLIQYGNDAEDCLTTIAELGNPREVVLKIAEVLEGLGLEDYSELYENAEGEPVGLMETWSAPDRFVEDKVTEMAGMLEQIIVTKEGECEDNGWGDEKIPPIDQLGLNQFCLLLKLLPIVHGRIKAAHPSRFLQTSLCAISRGFKASEQAAVAVVHFVHAISGNRRPILPGRKSSIGLQSLGPSSQASSVPDPEAEAQSSDETGIQECMLLELVIKALGLYIAKRPLEWAMRLHEKYYPEKIVPGRVSMGAKYQDNLLLHQRDTVVGQLVALIRDLGYGNPNSFYSTKGKDDSNSLGLKMNLSNVLFFNASMIFSFAYFGNNVALDDLRLFPDHMEMLKQVVREVDPFESSDHTFAFLDLNGFHNEIDAILMIGLFLERNDRFISGPLDYGDFKMYLDSLLMIAASSPDATYRSIAQLLASNIFHAHPDDMVRLKYISRVSWTSLRDVAIPGDPFLQGIKPLVVGWLKEEFVTAKQRESNNIFAGVDAMSYVYGYIFPCFQYALTDKPLANNLDVISRHMDFLMSTLNLLYLLYSRTFDHLVPVGMKRYVEETVLTPVKKSQLELSQAVARGGELANVGDESHIEKLRAGLELLGDKIDAVMRPFDARPQPGSEVDSAEEKEAREFMDKFVFEAQYFGPK